MTLEQILIGALLDSLLSITKGKRRASVFAMDKKVDRRRSLGGAQGSVVGLRMASVDSVNSTLSRVDTTGGGTRLGIVDQED